MAQESFIERVLIAGLAVKVVVVGEDFHFGSHREGNVRSLEAYGADHDFTVDPVHLVARADGIEEPISSTAIRRALAGGDVSWPPRCWAGRTRSAARSSSATSGAGCSGSRRPTSRCPTRSCLPADGVYAGWYERPGGETHPCAINLGRRPTFYEHADHSLLEAHLLDFAGDLYGERALVRFGHFLRSERKFDGLDAIKHQLTLDVEHARAVLAADSDRP